MPNRYRALAPVFVLAFAACSNAGSAPSTTAPAASLPAATNPGATRVNVKLTDALRMEPGEMAVKAGQALTFVVTNAGAIDHQFFLGDEAAQAAEEQMMQSGPMGDTAQGITVKPGETKELTYTFQVAGQAFAGCHVMGHYGAGMKALITVTP
ncbi:MAG: hypothetical protein HYX55_00045 [Chloroflexi bacterium]|nr:hypothetical protein [Chloroflexota bacterium]